MTIKKNVWVQFNQTGRSNDTVCLPEQKFQAMSIFCC